MLSMNRSSWASGKRIGSLLLDRVLSGQHEERVGQLVPFAAHGHLPLLHRLEQSGLGLGRRAVDLVGEHDVGEDRPSQELELPHAAGLVFLDDLGAGDVRGHQVGRELNAVIGQVERIGHRVDHQRLGQSGHADQEAVAAGEDRDQQLFEHPVLADDDLGHLALQLGERILQAFDGHDVVFFLQGCPPDLARSRLILLFEISSPMPIYPWPSPGSHRGDRP